MEYEIVTLQERIAVGVSARTNNASPDMGAVIGGLWNRFYEEGIYAGMQGLLFVAMWYRQWPGRGRRSGIWSCLGPFSVILRSTRIAAWITQKSTFMWG